MSALRTRGSSTTRGSPRSARTTAYGSNVDRSDFLHPDTVVQIGVPPNRVDLLTGLTGVEQFEEAWDTRAESEIAGHAIPFLGRETHIANKHATGRTGDLADLEALGEDAQG